MKRIALFLVMAAMLILVCSCDSKKQQQYKYPSEDKPEFVFTHEDTVEITEQVRDFISRLEAKDVRGAVEMLSFLSYGDTIKPLDAVAKRRQAMSLLLVRGVNYEMRHMTLRSYTNNEVKIDVKLFEKPEGDKRPNTTALYLRPVKFEGKWFLTAWDNMSNTNQDRNKD